MMMSGFDALLASNGLSAEIPTIETPLNCKNLRLDTVLSSFSDFTTLSITSCFSSWLPIDIPPFVGMSLFSLSPDCPINTDAYESQSTFFSITYSYFFLLITSFDPNHIYITVRA
jgi:hypothetical protein